MAVIHTGIDMPYSCFTCEHKVRCDRVQFSYTNAPPKLPDRCKLKSIDGLIDEINLYKNDVDKAISEDESKRAGLKQGYENCIEIIQNYCGG